MLSSVCLIMFYGLFEERKRNIKQYMKRLMLRNVKGVKGVKELVSNLTNDRKNNNTNKIK